MISELDNDERGSQSGRKSWAGHKLFWGNGFTRWRKQALYSIPNVNGGLQIHG